MRDLLVSILMWPIDAWRARRTTRGDVAVELAGREQCGHRVPGFRGCELPEGHDGWHSILYGRYKGTLAQRLYWSDDGDMMNNPR